MQGGKTLINAMSQAGTGCTYLEHCEEDFRDTVLQLFVGELAGRLKWSACVRVARVVKLGGASEPECPLHARLTRGPLPNLEPATPFAMRQRAEASQTWQQSAVKVWSCNCNHIGETRVTATLQPDTGSLPARAPVHVLALC